jgi:hypothetical protein
MEWPENPFTSHDTKEFVPPVLPADLKAVWQLFADVETSHPNTESLGAIAIDSSAIKNVCTPEADARDVWYRTAMLKLLLHVADRTPRERDAQELAKFKHGNEVDDRLFDVMAKIPLKWMPEEGMQGFPFDPDAFMNELREVA